MAEMGTISIQRDRPPFIRFDLMESGVDKEASERAGRPVPRTVPFVFITQPGSKDVLEAEADEWLERKRREAIEGRYSPEWVQRFQLQYDEWKKGNELPREGTPIKTWYALNKEQINRLIAIGLTTIEDLASYPDSSLGTIGLDGRYLRDLAKNSIKEGLDVGVQAKKIADLEQSNRDKDETIKTMQAQIAALSAAHESKTLTLPKKG